MANNLVLIAEAKNGIACSFLCRGTDDAGGEACSFLCRGTDDAGGELYYLRSNVSHPGILIVDSIDIDRLNVTIPSSLRDPYSWGDRGVTIIKGVSTASTRIVIQGRYTGMVLQPLPLGCSIDIAFTIRDCEFAV